MNIKHPFIAYRCILFAKWKPFCSTLLNFLSNLSLVCSLNMLAPIFFYIMFFIFFICDYKRTEKCSNSLYYNCGADVVIFIAHIYDIKFSNKLVFKIIIFISKIMSDRVISSCAHKFSLSSCKKCGVYDFGADSAIKTNLYDSYLNCSAAKYLHHMRKRSSKPIENKDIMESTFGLL